MLHLCEETMCEALCWRGEKEEGPETGGWVEADLLY